MRTLFRWFFIPLLLLAGLPSRANHAGSDEPFAADVYQHYLDRMGELDRMIKAEIGEPKADTLAQCRSIPFGAKACGGPATYLAFSTAKTDEAKLKALVDEYNRNARSYIQARKLISNCMFVSEPKLQWVDGICTLQWNEPMPPK